MTIDLRTHIEPMSMVAMATIKQHKDIFLGYCVEETTYIHILQEMQS